MVTTRRWILAVSLVAGLTLALGACGGGAGGEDGGREYITIGTAPSGGAFYHVGSAIAAEMEANGPEGWNVSAESTGGSMENMRLVMQDEMDLALSNATITWHAYHLHDEWADTPGVSGDHLPLANVMTMFPNIALFLTRADSGIEEIADLRGKRVYVGPEGAGFEYYIRPILEAHGMSFEDIDPVYGSQDAAVDYLGDGSVAAAMIGGGIPTSSISRASTSMDIHFIPFDDDAKAELIEEYPSYEEAVIPDGTYNGLEGDFPTLNVGSAHILTSIDADEEMIYQATKTIYESRAALKGRHAAAGAINEQNVIKDFGVPFHPGAIRYYREIGIWPDDSEVQ